MKKEALENIKGELFNSFNAGEVSGIGGDCKTYKTTVRTTFGPDGTDIGADFEIDFREIEELEQAAQ